MERFRQIQRELSAMAVLTGLLLVPAFMILLYVKLVVETSLLKRKIRVVTIEQQELVKKNGALKGAITSITREVRIEKLYRDRYGTGPNLARNRVVRVRLGSDGQ